MIRFLSILFFSLLFFPVLGQNFRFALLTDLHITTDSLAINDLLQSVSQINQDHSIKFVLVAGDITEEGDRASLVKAKSVLDKLNVNFYAVSGNHEMKWSESGATDFTDVFGSERFKFEYEDILFLGFPTGPILRMSDGHVAPQDIAWLVGNLEQAGKEKPVFLVTHYPMQNGDVDNWYEVTDAVRSYNIRAFLGGHYHQNRIFSYDGIPGFLNRSNLRGKENVGGYTVYDVSPDSVILYEQKIGEEAVKWASLSMTGRCFTKDNTEYERPDFSMNSEYPQVVEQWVVHSGNGIYASPVIYNQNVYVADELGNINCYDLDKGNLRWSYKVRNRIIGTPAVVNNIIVFGSADTYIYALDAITGTLRWKQKTGAAVLGAVVIENNIAYVGSSDHIFRAIDITTGKSVWEYNGVRGYVETRPLIYDNKVIFGAWDNTLYALDKEAGITSWKWDGGLTRMHFSPAAVWPVGAQGKVFITDPERAMTAIDVKTGKAIWRTKESMVRETIGLSEDGTRVYSKTMQDSVVCYATESDVPQKLWSTNVYYGYDHAPSMLIEKDGVVFGSTKNGLLFGLNGQTGELLWRYKVGNSLVNTVLPLTSNECVYTTSCGKIGLLLIK